MATVRASASSSIISILGTVNASAQSVAKVIEAGSDSVDMLTAFITKAKAEQAKAHLFAAKDYDDNLIHEAALAKSKREANLTKELRNDADLARLYQANHAEYAALLAPQGA
ncbi:hypothetical protein [Mesorhizobium sp. M7A.F.Ca.CA.002.12.1.1]|uniref:hypothetical protein n=1 Tax=Mesorhizobium sp. M7A.F.Ca.CA.002.12.1.1 TaxID=2496735 RepID=UPI000FCBA298|nr:hypothetical protein [Mesorhizobium sp. M7A.F.Ca.CA.002.12.1.1]RUX60146.1 hypothetical protein EN989_11035 [Mesorhizobium sp. M7A.F.Ca.CA.002.12.1.1]